MNGNKRTDREPKKLYEDKIISIGKVTKVTQGGRNFRFSATVAVGDRKGNVGIGTGKSKEIPVAVSKAIKDNESIVLDIVIKKDEFLPMVPPGAAVDDILGEFKHECDVCNYGGD